MASTAWSRGDPHIEPGQVGHAQVPWFTGPLLTPPGINIASGHFNFEPYVFANHQDSRYNSDWEKVSTPRSSWNINSVTFIQFGLNEWLDLSLVPAWFFHITKEATSFNLGDFGVICGFQLLKEKKGHWYPSIRFGLLETFPTGRFERLDPEHDGTDVSGAGAYTTGTFLVFSHLFHLWDNHWTNLRFALQYMISSKVRVHGFSSFGGSFDTNGWVYPPQTAEVFFGCEFNMTQEWVFAFDAVASFSKSTRFKGNSGFNELSGLPEDLSAGSSAQFSLAPALEYNWSGQLGLISGVWFTVAGRNSQAFTNWTTALNYYY
jgi:hypothetical protein